VWKQLKRFGLELFYYSAISQTRRAAQDTLGCPAGYLFMEEHSMDKTAFDKIKNFEYGGIKCRKTASWAVWDRENPENTRVIEQNLDRLKGQYVFVGLNFGGDNHHLEEDWKNFHSASAGDKRLRELFTGMEYEGAYMTDIIKNEATNNAGEIMEKIKSGALKRPVEKHIEYFIEEISLFNTENIKMFLFGRDTERVFRDYLMVNEKFLKQLKQKVTSCRGICHFSPRIPHFLLIARAQLELFQQLRTGEENHLLWNEP
jgi:hypothetical protein